MEVHTKMFGTYSSESTKETTVAMKQNQKVSDKFFFLVSDKLKANNFIESKSTQPILYTVPLKAKTHK